MKGVKGIGKGRFNRPRLNCNVEEILSFEPGKGEMLVEMVYAPVNPADFYIFRNVYRDTKPLGSVYGLEGMGRVIDTGSSEDSDMVGKLVNCLFSGSAHGSFSSHSIVKKEMAFPLDSRYSDKEQTNPFLINPLTAIGLVSKANEFGTESVLQIGASTSVGRIVADLCKERFKLINIVRDKRNIDSPVFANSTKTISSENESFNKEIVELIKEHEPGVVFDCIGGELTGLIFNSLPEHSKHIIYGALAMEKISHIDPSDLIFSNKTIQGFHLFRHFLNTRKLHEYTSELESINSNAKLLLDKAKYISMDSFNQELADYRNKRERLIFKFK